MIEVSSKFVRCLTRISQPRGDLNPERGPILNGTRRKTPHYTSTNAKPAGIIRLLNSLTAGACTSVARNLRSRIRDKNSSQRNFLRETARKAPREYSNRVLSEEDILLGEYSGYISRILREDENVSRMKLRIFSGGKNILALYISLLEICRGNRTIISTTFRLPVDQRIRRAVASRFDSRIYFTTWNSYPIFYFAAVETPL